MKNRLSPSILAADFSALEEDLALAEAAGANSFHFDIMDGHFVPNISYGAGIVAALRNKSKAFFDVHFLCRLQKGGSRQSFRPCGGGKAFGPFFTGD